MRNKVVKTVKDISENQVNDVINNFIKEECVTVKVKQDNGLWTVTARYPECDVIAKVTGRK